MGAAGTQPGGFQGQAENVQSNWALPARKQAQLQVTVAGGRRAHGTRSQTVWDFLAKPMARSASEIS